MNEDVGTSGMTQLLVFHLKLKMCLKIVALRDRSDVAVPGIGQPGLHT
jgi:hypothetical protein